MTPKILRYLLSSIVVMVFIIGLPGQGIPQEASKENYSGERSGANYYNEWAERFNWAKRTYKDFRVESVEEFIKINNYREKLISDGKVTHKFRTRGDQEIYCIDVYSQGSIERTGLRPEDIGFAPEVFPEGNEDTYAPGKVDPSVFGMDGSLDENGNVRKCPKGSFPRRIPSLEDLCRFRKLEDRFRKYPVQLEGSRGENSSLTDGHLNVEPPSTTHEYAHAYRYVDNIGQQADFNVWSPDVERSDEFSLCQLWVPRGSGSDLQTVETGWQKYYNLYGDWNPHLFIYFTTHNYDPGYPRGYNLDGGYFVQTDSSVIIGGRLSPVSTMGGSQYDCTLMFYRDPGGEHHWWLKYGDTWVGYYPNSLFDSEGIGNKSNRIDYGGEIVNQETGGLHTTTDMGSGRFPDEGWQYSAFVKHIRYVDMNCYYQDASDLIRRVTDASYYDLILYSISDPNWETYFYYGGPGRSAPCPTPGTPSNPNPSDGATGVSINADLDWSDCTNTDSYDVYFGTSSSPPYYGNTSSSNYNLPTLNYSTHYYWKIVAKNDCGNSAPGSVWDFTTGSAPCPTPGTPSNPNPSDGATGVSINADLDWSDCTNTDSYDVYFGTSSSPPYYGNTSSSNYNPTLDYNTHYYWKIVAKNDCGNSAPGPVWDFTTGSTLVVPIAYLKKCSATDYDLYIYSAPTTLAEQGTLLASDFWSPDGDTVAITAIDIDGDGTDEIAYLKKCSDTDYNLYIYSAPTYLAEQGTLLASDFWSADGNTVAISAIDIDGNGIDEIAYLTKYSATDYNLYIYSAPTYLGEQGTLLASDFWSADGDTVAITAIDIDGDGIDEIAYLKKWSDTDYNLYIYSAPTYIGEQGTLLASDFWSPDGNTVAISAIDIDGDGTDEIAYLKKYSDTDYDLYIYSAPTYIGEQGTLLASDFWSPDGDTVAISAP